ncbi:MAG: Tm-1-like ATP-binding domain-containing protein [Pseudomonadota bacterium]
MTAAPCILVAGTWDTKDAELGYMRDVIVAQGGQVLTMDVSVLGDPSRPTDISKHQVAEAAGSSIAAAIAAEDENTAMQIMAAGSARLAARLCAEGRIQGVIVLGGTMGTDLALDLCSALPLGVPKYVVSTVSFSPMLPPDRIPADIQMILWAGGLYGLNGVCKASLSQAAGAVLGAARAVEAPRRDKPLIGMTSFGKTVLRYMVSLKPALETRGFEVAVFHATGMGGRAFESLAAGGAFAAVLDFAPQEVGNHLFGSAISAGADRMTSAGAQGIPQVVSIGCCDLVDLVGWHPLPAHLEGLPGHAHNRLLSSVVLDPDGRRRVARALMGKLAAARGEVVFLLPLRGGNEWDREGGPLCDAEGLAAFVTEIRAACPANVRLVELDAHINDPAFSAAALAVVDGWIASGILPRG